MKSIGEQIAFLRKEHGMTQDELAVRIGVSAQSISKWENGVNLPDIMLLPIIADIFSITIDELFGKRISKTLFDDVPEAAYDALLSIMRPAIFGDSDFEEIKAFLDEHRAGQTAYYSGKGDALYANSELGLIWRKSELTNSEILTDEKALGFLSALSEPAFNRMLLYMLENRALSFTVGSVSAKCGISVAEAEKTITKLNEYNFVSCREVDAGGEQVKVYGLYGGHKMLLVYAILRLANRLADYREQYFGFRGDHDKWYC